MTIRGSTMPSARCHGLVALVVLAVASGFANTAQAAATGARRLAHVEGKIGDRAFSTTEPATMQESIAWLKAADTHPPLGTFGTTPNPNYIGFQQLIVAPDRSAVMVVLRMPEKLGEDLKPGTFVLGGITEDNVAQGSLDGWDSECPDTQTDNANVIIDHFGVPDPQAPRLAMIANGELLRRYQTHRTRIRTDAAQLTIKSLDRVARFIEGEASGEVSFIVPKDDEETNNRKSYHWMCRPGEYTVMTEAFNIRFQLHLGGGWHP